MVEAMISQRMGGAVVGWVEYKGRVERVGGVGRVGGAGRVEQKECGEYFPQCMGEWRVEESAGKSRQVQASAGEYRRSLVLSRCFIFTCSHAGRACRYGTWGV